MIFLTEYIKDGAKYHGTEIEADSFEAAQEIADQIAAWEQQTERRFSTLTVLGTKMAEGEWQDGLAHQVYNPTCDHCGFRWTAVFPAGLYSLQCPSCQKMTRVEKLK